MSVSVKQPIGHLILSNTAEAAVSGWPNRSRWRWRPRSIHVNNVSGYTLTDRVTWSPRPGLRAKERGRPNPAHDAAQKTPMGRSEPSGVRQRRGLPCLAGWRRMGPASRFRSMAAAFGAFSRAEREELGRIRGLRKQVILQVLDRTDPSPSSTTRQTSVKAAEARTSST